MNLLTEAKNDVKAFLVSAGMYAEVSPASKIDSRMVVIKAGSPYLRSENKFTSMEIGLTLVCIGEVISRDDCEEQLDTLIEQVVEAMPSSVSVESVGHPYELTVDTTTYFIAEVEISASITFNKEAN